MDDTTPFTPRPPRRWELITFTLLTLVAASAFLSLIGAVSYLGLYRALSSDGQSGVSSLVEFAANHGSGLDDFYFVIVIAYLFAQFRWQRETTSMLWTFGISDTRVSYHWAAYAWRFALLIAAAVRVVGGSLVAPQSPDPSPSDLVPEMLLYAAGHLVRMLALIVLLYGVWRIRDQVRQAVAVSGAAPTPAQLGLRRNRTPAAPLPAARVAALATAATPQADDYFWARARELSAEKGADLALLESTSAWVRRWLLVPAAGPIDAVRAAVPPGSVVTVFPEPPQPGDTAPPEPPESDPGTEWFGLIEDAGTLRFQRLAPTRLPVWLAQARAAHRWGLYRTDDPAALTAVVPSAIATVGTT
jgi:hypothetical protein